MEENHAPEALHAGGDRRETAASEVLTAQGSSIADGAKAIGVTEATRRRACVEHVQQKPGISERRACAALRQYRSTQRRTPQTADDEAALMADIVELARTYGRYG